MINQWSVYWAKLDPVEGSEQAGRRPVIVVSRDSINESLPILAVVPVTSFRRSGRIYPTEVRLPAGTAGLARESLALGHQLRTVSASRLLGRLGVIEDANLKRLVRETLRIFLDL